MLPLALAAEMHTKPVLPGRTKRKMTILSDISSGIGMIPVLVMGHVRSNSRQAFSLFQSTCVSPGLQKSYVRIYNAIVLLSVCRISCHIPVFLLNS